MEAAKAGFLRLLPPCCPPLSADANFQIEVESRAINPYVRTCTLSSSYY